MSSFTGSFAGDEPISPTDAMNTGYDHPRFPSQRFESQPVASLFAAFADGELATGSEDELFSSQPVAESVSVTSEVPILPSPAEMQSEEGYALREWRRQNAIRLEEKENEEKELLREIMEEADEYKAEFNRKWKLRCENNKAANREKEKLSLVSQEKFHAEAKKNYWKSIAELIPKEVPTIETRGKKEQANKPSIVVIQGPKPGKPTELSRMGQLLVKLKHNPPPHMKPPSQPSPSSEPGKEVKTSPSIPYATAPAKPVAVGGHKVITAARKQNGCQMDPSSL